MPCHIHHVHIFASNIEKSIRFYVDFFGGKVVLDEKLAGAHNVFIRIGSGRLHLYDQPPKNPCWATSITSASRPTISQGWCACSKQAA